MARNRKNQGVGLRLGPLVKVVFVCLFIGGFGVGYVWQKAAIEQLGRDIKHRETQLDGLKKKNEAMKNQLASMQSPPVLEMRIKELNLGLDMPDPRQVLWLAEPLPATVAGDARQYAAGQSVKRSLEPASPPLHAMNMAPTRR